MEIKGIGASPGIAIGKALVLEHKEMVIEKKENVNVEVEVEKLNSAVDTSKKELSAVKEKVAKELGEEEAEIFGAHLLVLEDPEFIGEAENKIKNESLNAEYALNEVKDMFVSIFESMDNDYMRERAADVKDVTNRVLRHILGIKIIDLSNLSDEVVLIAHDLTPSDTATMDKKKVLGFLTNIGGRTSHTAIMSRTLEIPAIVGLSDVTDKVKDSDMIVFDGDKGIVIVSPEEDVVAEYQEKKRIFEEDKKALELLKGQPSVTTDKKHVELAGNIGTPNDLEGLINNDAEGVGLYRTEFLYMDSDEFPSEEIQFEAYKKVLEGMNGKPVVIRTLDIGGDKKLSYFEMEEEMNPFLGYRAIRLCLDRTDIFKTQLRALFRASVYGKLRIMFPMISSLEELLAAKAICEEVKSDLKAEGLGYSDDVEIGMMIEIPSAAVISDLLAKHVDFFSIGTNDLIQYTCAVDRMNQKISYLYNQFNPAVLRLIKMVIKNAHAEGKWVGMCGESAGDQMMIPILLGFGLDEFSMSPISILRARRLINSVSEKDMQALSDKVLEFGTAKEIESYMKDFIASK
ncbi:phosphoenolpyruvate--protein phosphotransferase [Peptostreptococcus anaerobius]|mgnify:CR=1 FL=1|uniref:phosphoenolpyruvate--protein phosphotransferase n=1 Tax=Peptostreptococcus anaerobius TaxID=1261 RepID=UPI00232D96DC|nr:phosphoenolpyruvate--protein phosphotransferase [Peptostreptococcus anaerobius]MDB8821144.1 phosphoenolpyruvate--protein phosphotransferase [Peptostreptococcus anaerobius]MDB8825896.1 phosphoenolpyruvate--protein phosphotransferase [Peptostreptococcus anaerobius]MDB8827684.1 phosphoenolpyruvate--protein phosphotransferase [Peptostreptococcus anaerobius]MDB8829447.1 phosphoenolpyruvate--protein phosphotransferase [Peptostreptococcus anaerobius]MDB8831309.1 phosphoenolpyruvate--protein phosph